MIKSLVGRLFALSKYFLTIVAKQVTKFKQEVMKLLKKITINVTELSNLVYKTDDVKQ